MPNSCPNKVIYLDLSNESGHPVADILAKKKNRSKRLFLICNVKKELEKC